ncbi:MAG: hypothetical protein CSA49_04790 [Gammaproteobacteria bacterium]|nr:MAG: hypothetical protein CSA49_04790 [Gammaproteobacteria bacterium]
MTPELEKTCSAQVRELSRNYADGHFNKEEFRRRRREILERCTGTVGESTANMPRAATSPTKDSRHTALFWWRVAGGFSIMLIGIMGYLLYRIS